MIDIFIKSFNRPYYLDRCLYSIDKFVKGAYKVSILDDGTPEKYLQKIKEKYPFVNIIKSDNYTEKNKAIDENITSGKEINGFQIPTNLWREAAKNASEYFIMTEDDVWFTNTIHINEVAEKAKNHQISLLKLGWLGNRQESEWETMIPIDPDINATQPKNLFFPPTIIEDYFFYNKCKFFSLLYKLKLVDNLTLPRYSLLNSTLMGFWQKDYWLSIWDDVKGKNEIQQIKNALKYYKKRKNNPNFIAKLSNEAMKTTFQSSATNSYHQYGIAFDVNLFNHFINEAWYQGNFEVLQNFPKDFSLDYLESFVSGKIDLIEYRKWVEKFRNQYALFGCDISND